MSFGQSELKFDLTDLLTVLMYIIAEKLVPVSLQRIISEVSVYQFLCKEFHSDSSHASPT